MERSLFVVGLFIYTLWGTQVQSLSFEYLSDFVVEGGRSINVTVDETKEFDYRLSRECPSKCRELVSINIYHLRDKSVKHSIYFIFHEAAGAAFPVTLTRIPKGFSLKAEDNDVVDPLFVIRVDVYDKTNAVKSLKSLRFTFVDNDRTPVKIIEGSLDPLQVTVVHPPNMPQTEYTFTDVLDQNFNKRWQLDPLKVVFNENEGGNKTLQIFPRDDRKVEVPTKYILVIKRLSTCEPVQRYYKHVAVEVNDNDVEGEFKNWSSWSACTVNWVGPFRDCYKKRTRECQHKESNFGGTPICSGASVETIDVPCSNCTAT
ncbi:uncharacterized protein LOC133185016 [Saccostrea echinata]|uniref:uncharacterized protein LOC133185016 n=1 Tax=Saccostrea echinata TaxID=191078 RepID=UPI002A7F8DFC|nr:uncharacterized protein LOC133185016 [Saccostrea echinata]